MRIVLDNPWVRAGGVLGLLVLFSLLCYFLSSVLVPLFFAFIVAYAFDPIIDVFERFKVRRMIAIMTLLVFLFGAMMSIPLFVIPGLITEGEKLASRAATGLQDQWLDRALEKLPITQLLEQLESMSATEEATVERPLTEEEAIVRKHLRATDALQKAGVEPVVSGLDTPEQDALAAEQNVRARLLQQIGELVRENATTFVATNIREILGAGQTVGSTAAGVIGSLFSFLISGAIFTGNLALFLFVTIYLLNDYDRIVATCDGLVPPRKRPEVRRVMGKIDLQLRAFFRGQGMVCTCLGVMYGIGFLACGVPFAVPLAIFGGIASFVPYLGLALTIGPAVILTLLVSGIGWPVLGVLATFGVAQFLEGNFITPAIVGKQVGLGPVWVILAVMVFGSTMGFTGLLIAVPVAAVLKVVMEELVEQYRASQLYGVEPSPPEGDGAAG